MKTVSNITTSELEDLQRKLELPKTLEESLMLRGVEAELSERWGNPDETNIRLAYSKAKNELDHANHEIENLEGQIEDLNQEIEDLKDAA